MINWQYIENFQSFRIQIFEIMLVILKCLLFFYYYDLPPKNTITCGTLKKYILIGSV